GRCRRERRSHPRSTHLALCTQPLLGLGLQLIPATPHRERALARQRHDESVFAQMPQRPPNRHPRDTELAGETSFGELVVRPIFARFDPLSDDLRDLFPNVPVWVPLGHAPTIGRHHVAYLSGYGYRQAHTAV